MDGGDKHGSGRLIAEQLSLRASSRVRRWNNWFWPVGRTLVLALGVCTVAEGSSADVLNSLHSADQGLGLPVRGVVRSIEQATISAELSARVAAIAFQEGEAVAKDDVLIEFDCRRQRAELAGAIAERKEMQIALDTNSFLATRDAASRQDIDVAVARAAKADASVQALQIQIENCRISAPFSGRVAQIAIRQHELSVPGHSLITILNDRAVEVDLIVPSNWLSWLTLGEEFEFKVDETGETHKAAVRRIGAAVETVSQTVKVTGAFNGAVGNVIPGMSGAARFLKHEQ